MIIGHQKILNFLDRSIEKNTVSQAYLFSGPEHLGKFTVAIDFAQKLTGSDKKINPDIAIVAPETDEKKGVIKKKDIKVEQIRELQKELSLTPSGGKMKVAIIDDAERLTISSQNALLKTLEEPNGKTVIVLICHNQEKIIPTIKSRCVTKNFYPVSKGDLRENVAFGENIDSIIFWAAGRPGLAIELSRHPEKLERFSEYGKDFETASRGNVAEKFSLAESLAKDAGKLSEELRFWTVLLREKLFFGNDRVKKLGLIENVEESLRLVSETNSNPRVILENLFLKF